MSCSCPWRPCEHEFIAPRDPVEWGVRCRAVGCRVEVRDYVSRLEPLTGTGETKRSNDVTIVTGITDRF